MGSMQKAANLRNICVYCGSGPGRNKAFAEAARDFGRILADENIGLVYGGGSLGLMGETARSVIRHGGRVTGIIPAFLSAREHMLLEAHELVVVDNMHQRKHLMFMKSDAFVALPGGLGTLEEFVEQLTWSQLEQHQKPIVLANIDGFWDPLLSLFARMRRGKLHPPRARASPRSGGPGGCDHSRHHPRAYSPRRDRGS